MTRERTDLESVTKRIFDIILAMSALLLLLVPIIGVAVLIRLTSKGPVIYWSDRIGRNNTIFRMPKFRTMCVDAPVVATHLMNNPDAYLTVTGRFLRRTSLDELPQLWSIAKGDMSFVGPRPALCNQVDLIEQRRMAGVAALVPGLTGWAQVNGRDDLPIPEKVKFDREYLQKKSFSFDLKILALTLVRVLQGHGVSH